MNTTEALQARATTNGHKKPVEVANKALGTNLTEWDQEKNKALEGPDGKPLTDPVAKHDALWGLMLKKAAGIINSDPLFIYRAIQFSPFNCKGFGRLFIFVELPDVFLSRRRNR